MKSVRIANLALTVAGFVILVECGSVISLPSEAEPIATPLDSSPPSSPVKTLKIVASLPLTGVALTDTETVVNAEKLGVSQADYQACGGKYTLDYEAWDDATALTGQWDPAVETENAMRAAGDPSVVAYLGPFNSGAAKLSIPILNQAGPLVMISPANTYSGLTKPGYGPGEPDIYYPTKIRNYTRVVTADDIQGKVDANFMYTQLNVTSVYILDDQQLYGKGIADVFESTAKSLGMKVLGHEGIDSTALDYRALMTKISTSDNGRPPEGIFVGMTVDNNAAKLLRDKVAVMGDNSQIKFMGPDGIQTKAMIDGASASIAEGLYASVAGIPQEKWNANGKKFLTDYQAKYGKLAEPFTIYGFETMNVLLQAIENICASGGDPSDRRAVRDAVFAMKDFQGVLGTWSFDANGDISLTDMTIYRVKNGAYVALGTFK